MSLCFTNLGWNLPVIRMPAWAVWPNWAIFESCWWKKYLLKQHKCLHTFRLFWKAEHLIYNLLCVLLENLWKKCGLLFIPTSDHTVHRRFIRCNLCRLGLKYFGMEMWKIGNSNRLNRMWFIHTKIHALLVWHIRCYLFVLFQILLQFISISLNHYLFVYILKT